MFRTEELFYLGVCHACFTKANKEGLDTLASIIDKVPLGGIAGSHSNNGMVLPIFAKCVLCEREGLWDADGEYLGKAPLNDELLSTRFCPSCNAATFMYRTFVNKEEIIEHLGEPVFCKKCHTIWMCFDGEDQLNGVVEDDEEEDG